MFLLEHTPDSDWRNKFNLQNNTTGTVTRQSTPVTAARPCGCSEEIGHCSRLIRYSALLNLALECMWLYDNVKSPGGTEWVIMSHCFLNYSNFKSTAGKETKNNIIGIWCCALSWTFFYPRIELGLSQGVQWYELLSEHALLFLRNAFLAAKQLIRHSHFPPRGMILHFRWSFWNNAAATEHSCGSLTALLTTLKPQLTTLTTT